MHAGELGDLRNTRDAAIFGVQRIGHGTNLIKSPITVEYYRETKIPVIVNLVSNLRLTYVKKIQDHPFLDYARLGIPVAMSTDDDGILETTPNKECETAISGTDITYKELKDMYLNSISIAFIDDKEKQQLTQKLDEQFKTFESQYRQTLGSKYKE
jgi:adenosine deaminase